MARRVVHGCLKCRVLVARARPGQNADGGWFYGVIGAPIDAINGVWSRAVGPGDRLIGWRSAAAAIRVARRDLRHRGLTVIELRIVEDPPGADRTQRAGTHQG